MKSAVVIPWAEGHSGLCCIRSLGKKNVKVIAASSENNAIGFRSKYTTEKLIYPNPNIDFEGFSEFILNQCKRRDILTVFPLTEYDIYTLSKHRDIISNHIPTIFPSFKTVRKTQDRIKLYKIAKELGIPIIKTWLLGEKNKSDNELYIVKPRYSVLEKENKLIKGNVRYLENNDSVDEEVIIKEMGHVPIVQEYIDGEEYGFYSLFYEGKPIAKFQQHRIRSINYKGGASSFREFIKKTELEKLGLNLLKKLKWHGPAMVEFKKDNRTGEFKLMEVNPRFWGSLSLSVFSGLDLPYLYYELSKNNNCRIPFSYKENIKAQYFIGEICHLFSIVFNKQVGHIPKPNFFKNFFSVISNAPSSRHDVFDLNDFRPFLQDIINLLRANFA